MTETILQKARDKHAWLEFLEYKLDKQHFSRAEETELREFIETEEYLSLCDLWEKEQLPQGYPQKRTINKQGSRKKRVIYTFPGADGILLKFIAFHLYRYDGYFCNNCYAFRRNFGVWEAIHRIRSTKNIGQMYCLKVDISNYFNSIDVDILLGNLSFIQDTDLPLYKLFSKILKENRVMENTKLLLENHGAMAGTPTLDEEDDEETMDFTWSRWFFPNLTTDKELKIIDTYFQEYIRYTVTGRHYKGNYRISYNQLK